MLLAPTRELALQTHKAVRDLARFTDLRTAVLVGGDAMEAQFAELALNPDIIVATPGARRAGVVTLPSSFPILYSYPFPHSIIHWRASISGAAHAACAGEGGVEWGLRLGGLALGPHIIVAAPCAHQICHRALARAKPPASLFPRPSSSFPPGSPAPTHAQPSHPPIHLLQAACCTTSRRSRA